MSRPLSRRMAVAPPRVRGIGDWVGRYGTRGYWLPAFNSGTDVESLPAEVSSVTVGQGTRFVWADPSTDLRALESPDTSSRSAATLYDTLDARAVIAFSAAYVGTLHLYILGWDQVKLLTLSLSGVVTASQDTGDTQDGLWMDFPINVAAAGNLTVDSTLTNGALNSNDPVLTGVFFD